jgi:hypothetical protein
MNQTKKSLFDKMEHRLDQIQNLGYDYKGKLFQNTLSNVILSDSKRVGILNQFEKIIYQCIESVKLIKVDFNYTFKKNYRKFN